MTCLALKNRNLIAVMHDTIMAAASFGLALYLRFGAQVLIHQPPYFLVGTAACTVICVAVFILLRLYRGLWRYASIQDLVSLTKAVTLSLILFYSFLFLYNRLEMVPRSVPVIHWLALLAMLGGPRFVYRVVKDRLVGRSFSLRDDARIPVLLIGATPNTEHFLRETERNANANYRVVGIVEDDARFHSQVMHGVRIYSDMQSIPYIVKKLERRGDRPQRMILGSDNLDGTVVRQLLDMAEELGMTLARLPKLTEFKHGLNDRQDIRPIAVEDLLGRAQNIRDKTLMRALVSGKRVMVTGAGGTIGGELVRQLAEFAPSAIYLLEQSEFNLYSIDQELEDAFPHLPRKAIIADVRDEEYVDHLLGALKPHIVFHAAAIKHVPLAEHNPEEAILTNAIGTKNVANACVEHDVEAMVLISTDKAVNPANVMGATKRLAETYCQALGSDAKARKKTRFITVRFGNVLGSTGSVVPLFEKQLKRGGPLTITHPDMVRYFMTVREAVELVLQAAAMGARPEESRSGLIFVLDMGKPVKIADLAVQMIRLSGFKPNEDIQIVYTGLRPGEKLYEELFHYSESSLKTDHEGVMLASSRKADLASLELPMAKLRKACEARDVKAAFLQLQKLVPEFHSASLEEDDKARALTT